MRSEISLSLLSWAPTSGMAVILPIQSPVDSIAIQPRFARLRTSSGNSRQGIRCIPIRENRFHGAAFSQKSAKKNILRRRNPAESMARETWRELRCQLCGEIRAPRANSAAIPVAGFSRMGGPFHRSLPSDRAPTEPAARTRLPRRGSAQSPCGSGYSPSGGIKTA